MGRPVTHLDKPTVLDGLFASWRDIDTLLHTLDPAQWTMETSLPGWTVHDVVAHIVGTESMLHGDATPEVDVDVSTLKHVRNDIGALNERWVRKLRGLSSAELHERYRSVTALRRTELSELSARLSELSERAVAGGLERELWAELSALHALLDAI